MSEPCQVDFYVLANPSQSAQHLACRLAMMAWEQGHRVAVLTEDGENARSLDEAMWDYPPGRFLPHAVGAKDAQAPVSILARGGEIAADRDVVINLAQAPVPEPDRFTRLLEIVPGDEQQRLASRRKFREYRELGLEPRHHEIGKN